MSTKLYIFDLDGVLVNTSHIHTNALRQAVFESCGKAASEEAFLDARDGKSTKSKLERLAHYYQFNFDIVDTRKKELTLEQITTLPKCHLTDYLLELKSQRSLLALATNSRKEFVDAILTQAGLKNLFDVVITGSDVEQHKPHPEIFAKVISYIYTVTSYMNPLEVTVFEDSEAGVTAAEAAGAHHIIKIDPDKLLQPIDFLRTT